MSAPVHVDCDECDCLVDDSDAHVCDGCLSVLCDDCLEEHDCDGER